jgi:hypothetical protein
MSKKPLGQELRLSIGIFSPAHIYLCHPAFRSLWEELHLQHPPYESGVLLLNYRAKWKKVWPVGLVATQLSFPSEKDFPSWYRPTPKWFKAICATSTLMGNFSAQGFAP